MSGLKSTQIAALLGSLTLLGACSSTREATAPRSSAPLSSSASTVSLTFINYQPQNGARIRLTNNSKLSIAWKGYPGTPWYRLRQRDLFGWHERDVGWFCGKGLETRHLFPNDSTEFSVELPTRDLRSIQVGLDYTTVPKQSYSVWSSPFSPKE